MNVAHSQLRIHGMSDLASISRLVFNASPMSTSAREVRRIRIFAGSYAPNAARTIRTVVLMHSAPLSSKASMTTTTFPVGEPVNWERGSRMSFFYCAATSSMSLNEWLLVVTSTRSGRKRRSEVTISQITRDGREELHMEPFVLSDATETETRSKHAEILDLQSNCVRDG